MPRAGSAGPDGLLLGAVLVRLLGRRARTPRSCRSRRTRRVRRVDLGLPRAGRRPPWASDLTTVVASLFQSANGRPGSRCTGLVRVGPRGDRALDRVEGVLALPRSRRASATRSPRRGALTGSEAVGQEAKTLPVPGESATLYSSSKARPSVLKYATAQAVGDVVGGVALDDWPRAGCQSAAADERLEWSSTSTCRARRSPRATPQSVLASHRPV